MFSWLSASSSTGAELVPAVMVTWGLWILFGLAAFPGEYKSQTARQRFMGACAGVIFLYALYLSGWLIVRAQGLS